MAAGMLCLKHQLQDDCMLAMQAVYTDPKLDHDVSAALARDSMIESGITEVSVRRRRAGPGSPEGQCEENGTPGVSQSRSWFGQGRRGYARLGMYRAVFVSIAHVLGECTGLQEGAEGPVCGQGHW